MTLNITDHMKSLHSYTDESYYSYLTDTYNSCTTGSVTPSINSNTSIYSDHSGNGYYTISKNTTSVSLDEMLKNLTHHMVDMNQRMSQIEKALEVKLRDKTYEEKYPYIKELFEKYEESANKSYNRYLKEIEKAKTFEALKTQK